jgi:Putative transposase
VWVLKVWLSICKHQWALETASEFICRFLLHVLPDGFMRIRHYGFLGNRIRTCRIPAFGYKARPIWCGISTTL